MKDKTNTFVSKKTAERICCQKLTLQEMLKEVLQKKGKLNINL